LRILLIEDEPLIAYDLTSIVEGLGHEVVGVADCRAEAVHLAAQLRPQAALVDMKLRDGFTGPAIARQLLQDFHVSCAYVTGNPEQCAGILPVVTKPFSDLEVARVVAGLAA
jgi:CheY-like chemotaxis protein